MTMYLSAATFLALAVCSEAFVIPVGTTLTYPRSTISFVAEPLALSDDVAADGDVLEEPVAEVPAAEEEQEDEEPKKVIARERHTMFVGNLPFDTTDADVRDFFAQHGKVELVSVPRNKETGLPRGFAFVDMSTEEELEAAVANLDGVMFNERLLRVTKSVPKEEIKKTPRNKSPEPVDGQKIYVGNLPFEATREQLMELYSQYGEVKSVFIPSDRTTGAGRGFAFVTMSDEDAANAIESTNGMEFEGRRLVVSEPLPPGEKGGPRRKPQVKVRVRPLVLSCCDPHLSHSHSLALHW